MNATTTTHNTMDHPAFGVQELGGVAPGPISPGQLLAPNGLAPPAPGTYEAAAQHAVAARDAARPRSASGSLNKSGTAGRGLALVVPRMEGVSSDSRDSKSSKGSGSGERRPADFELLRDHDFVPNPKALARNYNEALQPLVRLIIEESRRASQPPRPESARPVDFLSLGPALLDRCLGLYLGAVSLGFARCSCSALRRRGGSSVGLCALERSWLSEDDADEVVEGARARNGRCTCGGPPWMVGRQRLFRGDFRCTQWRAKHVGAVAARLLATPHAAKDARFGEVIRRLAGCARVRFAAVRKSKVGHLDPDFMGPALRHLITPSFLAKCAKDDAFTVGGGFVGLIIERVSISLALFGTPVVLLIETSRFEEATHQSPEATTVVAEAVKYAVDAAAPAVLFTRAKTTPPAERWSQSAWTKLAGHLGVDAADDAAKAAARHFSFGVAESLAQYGVEAPLT
mmetsp:Transcript_24874/g.74623  ORF Transcript_24874/g.74623 Transcript_24874/m.74623 type:complete len:458 (-) Transcript_24874:122-1495(-)|eukprot:CAMPEP_0119262080 /NCGR_PEP_ID=MMETSP1329-20130426/1912_1 /TAXON_ID=114041 /ORGANISM="Genus nov. species nov., Strain RCC1024" /LENGTH=457 /DNA_ID=CAMNT_0007261689 /DNA_START=327 /DNA_END=1700 /DNA_ORIENTATION=-